jgi:hypothetical protein
MSLLSATEMMEEGSREAHWSLDGGRTYQRKFRCITNRQDDGPNTVLGQFGTNYGDLYNPSYNTSTEQDLFACVQAIDIEPEGNDGLMWIITLSYGWYNPLQAGGGKEQNPLQMPIEVSWALRDHEAVLQYDVNGNPVLNTAGDPYDPPVVIDDPRLVMTVVRNEAQFNVGWVLAYRNAVNSDPFAGFPALMCKVLNISSRSQWHQDVGWYYQTTYEFEFTTSQIDYDTQTGFREKIVSMGFRAISSVTGLPYHITLKGVPISAPMTLDKSGYLLGGNNTTPYYQTFQAYAELPFAVFGFDIGAISGQRSGYNYTPSFPPG